VSKGCNVLKSNKSAEISGFDKVSKPMNCCSKAIIVTEFPSLVQPLFLMVKCNNLLELLGKRFCTIACAQRTTGFGSFIASFNKPLHHTERLDKLL
jgi:hypothetical protein